MKTIRFRNHKNLIYRRLVEACQKNQLSQQDLASKMQAMGVNIDQQAISKIKLDKRLVTDYELMYICKILNVEYQWIIQDQE